jgi:hypothetical protein
MKFCKDCNWYREGKIHDYCYHPSSLLPVADLIRGTKAYKTCQIMREFNCGEDGALFDPKLNLLQRILINRK